MLWKALSGKPPDAPRPTLDVWWWPDQGPESPRQRRAGTDAVLRQTLAPYLDQAPEGLAFSREARGRPYLADPEAPDFNLSDTTGGRLVAVWRVGRVGVDLERSDRQPPVARLARRWFAADEAAALAALGDEQARRAFLALWTAKEAACKATGTGIYGRLDQWRFAVAEGSPQLLAAPGEAGDRDDWHFLRLAPPGGAHTAVAACRGPRPEPRGFLGR